MREIEKEIYVVGVKHRMNRDRRVVLAEILARGPVPLKLTREQENQYDMNAIRVNVVGPLAIEGVNPDHFLGYIGMDSAAVLADPIDAGTLVVLDANLVALQDVTENHCKGVMAVKFGKVEE